jgi:signal transduction histidine kinase
VGIVVGVAALSGSSSVAIALATLATAAIAWPAREHLQKLLDQRFNRREFDAVSRIKRFVKEPPPSTSIEQALRDALGSTALTVAYWIDEREQWVTEAGKPVPAGPADVIVERRGSLIARVGFDESTMERRLVETLLTEASTELENARLRSAITLQLREVEESRSRIVAAQLEERRRLERNLHDGAQQRLLAVALELRAAEVSRDPERQSTSIQSAVSELQVAVRELRQLANGLLPPALAGGGLAAALEELASRTPTLIVTEACRDRLTPKLEEAAWFIACEAVANAVKHAEASSVTLSAVRNNGSLFLLVADDGAGTANPDGRGLRGIADRANAIGGKLTVESTPGRGTVVKAELPCE